MESDLVQMLTSSPVSCRLLTRQDEGPYHRDDSPLRSDITEDRDGLPLRLGLRLLASDGITPLPGVVVEVWHADKDGRYSGFPCSSAAPGQVVTSDSVPRDIVAADETFLRGRQLTDERGLCVFSTIYPGWYPGRTVHIHVIAHLDESHSVVSQLYFPDEVTDEVFAQAPYCGRPSRDTTNATDTIFPEGGTQTTLWLRRDADGFAAVLCAVIARAEEDTDIRHEA
jgi:protocatechuate 3,4-dioxygenase beta subunit